VNIQLHRVARLKGPAQPFIKNKIPADKSTSHRALILAALAKGKSSIVNLLQGEDVLSTLNCLKSLGISVADKKNHIFITGSPLSVPSTALDCGNSGTTLRLLMGVLASQSFSTILAGDPSLSRRPMGRVALPLRTMGASIELTNAEFAPLKIQGNPELKAIDYTLPIASAQLKSALLLAGLSAEGTTHLSGKIDSRDHSERLLTHFGVLLKKEGGILSIHGGQSLSARDLKIPGDPSSAAYWIALALLTPNATLEFSDILLNPYRTGFLRVLKRMGAKIETEVTEELPDLVGKIRVSTSSLNGTVIDASEIPSVIDELPLLSMLAAFAEGKTEIQGASELRLKESDRIEATATNLRAMGAEVQTSPTGLTIFGKDPTQSHGRLKGARISSFGDHRIAMTFAIAGLAATGKTEIEGCECVAISYPHFFETLREVVE
jgi:3-phosphoshikimate 1-carboxyvinyltransferase